MTKSFKNQLSEFAISHGFDVNKVRSETTKSQAPQKKLIAKGYWAPIDKKLQNIIQLANVGRKGEQIRVKNTIDMTGFLNFIRDCKQKDKISEPDEYFCLCSVANIDDFPAGKIYEFRLALRYAEVKIIDLLHLNKLSDEDNKAYHKQLEMMKIRQKKIRNQKASDNHISLAAQENTEKQKERNHYIFLAQKVLLSGIDVDAKISSTPILDEDDFTLSIGWLDDKLKNEIKNSVNVVLEKFGEDYEVGRVLSARAAEKAAKIFYQRCGFQVEDVSIHQINQNKADDWKYFDLKVNNYTVDVKNSRRAISSPDRYVEHCVPKKGKITRNDEKVTIAGILSRYLWPKTLLAPEEYKDPTSLIFLGETTYGDHSKLKDQFSNEHFDIDFGRPDRDANFFLPPWIFNYPTALYESRNLAIAELARQGAPDYLLCQQMNFNCIPSCLAAKINLSEYWTDDAFKKWEWELYQKMLNRIGAHGLSLPFIFLAFLSHFIEMIPIRSVQQTNYRPYQYRRFVYMNKDEYNKPLGIYDPLYTISSLIDVLDKLWAANHDLISTYKYFKLSGFHIFQGKRLPKDDWETLIAYCGGWIDGKGNCGQYPLVLGDSKRCDICKKLICPKCGFCRKGCSNPYHAVQDHAERKFSYDKDIPF